MSACISGGRLACSFRAAFWKRSAALLPRQHWSGCVCRHHACRRTASRSAAPLLTSAASSPTLLRSNLRHLARQNRWCCCGRARKAHATPSPLAARVCLSSICLHRHVVVRGGLRWLRQTTARPTCRFMRRYSVLSHMRWLSAVLEHREASRCRRRRVSRICG